MPEFSDRNAERKFKQVDLRIGRLDEDIRRLFERIASATGASTGTPTTASSAGTIVAGAGLVGGGTIPGTVTLDVGAGDGLDVNADDIDVDVTDIIDTAAGITEAANNIQVNLGTGLTFNAGAVILDWAASPVTIEPDDATVDGVSLYAARIDHQHAIVAAAPGADSVDVGASAEGAATSFARSDHTHNLDESIAPTWAGIHTFQADIQLDANLDFVGAQLITTTAGDLTIAPAGDIVLNPTGNDILPTSHRDLNIGNLTTWYAEGYIDQLHAGTIKTVVFESDVINVFNGSFMIAKSSSSLAVAKTFAANGVGDTFVANESGRYSVGDFVRLKDIGDDTWLEVTGVGGDPTINVTVRDGGTGSFDAGNPIVNYGASGQGLMMFTALDISAGSHTLNAPGMSVFDHAGAPWTTTTEYVRLGNLNGWGGFAADKWGIGLGRYAANYPNFYVNASDGVMKMRIHSTDYLKFDYNAGSPLAQIVGDLEVSGGSIVGGSGNVIISDDGIILPSHPGAAYSAVKSLQFKVGATEYGHLGSFYATPGVGNDYHTVQLKAESVAAKDTHLQVIAGKTASYASLVVLNVPGVEFALHNTDAAIYAALGPTDGETDVLLYLNETANVNMTTGITINQVANDDELLAFKSSDVAHGITTDTETDTYGYFKKASPAGGGLLIAGITDTDAPAGGAIVINGKLGEAADTTKTTAGIGVVQVIAQVKNGAGLEGVGADGNLMTIANQTTTRFIFDAEGSALADVEWIAFDEYDDLALLDTLETTLVADQDLEAGFGGWIDENKDELERLGIAHFDDRPGHAMVNTTRLNMLLVGALRQAGARLARLEDHNGLC